MASASTAGAGICPWDALPLHLQERILALLPLTQLLPVAAASRALRRLIRSSDFHTLLSPHCLDAFFLLSPRHTVHPLSLRILPTSPLDDVGAPPSPPLVSSASPSILITPAMLHHLPPLPASSYLLSIVLRPSASPSSTTYTLVAVTTGADVCWYTLNTSDPIPQWTSRGDLPLPFALLGNAVVSGDCG